MLKRKGNTATWAALLWEATAPSNSPHQEECIFTRASLLTFTCRCCREGGYLSPIYMMLSSQYMLHYMHFYSPTPFFLPIFLSSAISLLLGTFKTVTLQTVLNLLAWPNLQSPQSAQSIKLTLVISTLFINYICQTCKNISRENENRRDEH